MWYGKVNTHQVLHSCGNIHSARELRCTDLSLLWRNTVLGAHTKCETQSSTLRLSIYFVIRFLMCHLCGCKYSVSHSDSGSTRVRTWADCCPSSMEAWSAVDLCVCGCTQSAAVGTLVSHLWSPCPPPDCAWLILLVWDVSLAHPSLRTTGWRMLLQSVTKCAQPAYCAWSKMWHVTDRCMDYTFGHCTGLCAGCINSHCNTLTLCVFVLVALLLKTIHQLIFLLPSYHHDLTLNNVCFLLFVLQHDWPLDNRPQQGHIYSHLQSH